MTLRSPNLLAKVTEHREIPMGQHNTYDVRHGKGWKKGSSLQSTSPLRHPVRVAEHSELGERNFGPKYISANSYIITAVPRSSKSPGSSSTISLDPFGIQLGLLPTPSPPHHCPQTSVISSGIPPHPPSGSHLDIPLVIFSRRSVRSMGEHHVECQGLGHAQHSNRLTLEQQQIAVGLTHYPHQGPTEAQAPWYRSGAQRTNAAMSSLSRAVYRHR